MKDLTLHSNEFVSSHSGLHKLVRVKVREHTRQVARQLLVTANDKPLGRKIRMYELYDLALSLLQQEHLEQLRQRSLTFKDRLEMSYRRFTKEHGQVSMDDFLGSCLQRQTPRKG